MSRHEMRFAGRWKAPLPPGTLYAKPADIEHYPGWWPAFRLPGAFQPGVPGR
ncbi:hypothetical protein GCM10010219_13480 [Streptomyces netropsis]|nr:hypothetical protein GCM10010219_13480 [Streptomyces netropsis]